MMVMRPRFPPIKLYDNAEHGLPYRHLDSLLDHGAGGGSRPPQAPGGLGLDPPPAEWYFESPMAMRPGPKHARTLPVFDRPKKNVAGTGCSRCASTQSYAARPRDSKTSSH